MVQEHPARLESFLANIAARFQQNGKSNLCLLELRNDRRPSKLAFEKLVGEAMTQSRARQGPSAQVSCLVVEAGVMGGGGVPGKTWCA